MSTELFGEGWTGDETLCRLELTEEGGRTLLKQSVLYASRESRDAVLHSPMASGVATGYDRMERLLVKGVEAGRERDCRAAINIKVASG